jgi:hypothetical protein
MRDVRWYPIWITTGTLLALAGGWIVAAGFTARDQLRRDAREQR